MLICTPNKDLTCEIKRFRNGEDAVLYADLNGDCKMLWIKTAKNGLSTVPVMHLEWLSKAPNDNAEKQQEIIEILENKMLTVINKASLRYTFEKVELETPDVLHQFATQIYAAI